MTDISTSSYSKILQLMAACSKALPVAQRDIGEPPYKHELFVSPQFAAVLLAFHDLTEIDAVYEKLLDLQREAGIEPVEIPRLEPVTTPVRHLNADMWGEAAE